MKVEREGVLVQQSHFSPAQILQSGQCFRMEETEPGHYGLIAGSRYLELEDAGQGEVMLACGRQEYESFWKDYFDLEGDYEGYIRSIDPADLYLTRAAARGEGIRILRQDLWEMLLTFIISQQNNIRRIRKIIALLSERYGAACCSREGKEYGAFPLPEELAQVTEEEYRSCGLGYRSRYLASVVRSVLEGEVDLEAVAAMDYPEARKELMKLCGVGGKVADCICLFALHHLEAFPVDTHIRKVLDMQYPDGFPSERYRGFQGVLQQYLFYYDLQEGR